jgi:Zinc finger, C3HC4 type (RING finger)
VLDILGNADMAQICKLQVEEILAAPQRFIDQVKAASGEEVHVFVDWSNIEIGATVLANGQRDRGVAVDVAKLVAVVENGRDARTRFCAGSISAAGGGERTAAQRTALAEPWQRVGYKVRIGERSTGGGESFVDDLIVADMNRAMFVDNTASRGSTIVLLSGDGNDNTDNTFLPSTGSSSSSSSTSIADDNDSFVRAVLRAIAEGFKVEVWSWRQSLSRRYVRLARDFGDRIKICHLDEHRNVITKRRAVEHRRRPSSSSSPPSAAMTVTRRTRRNNKDEPRSSTRKTRKRSSSNADESRQPKTERHMCLVCNNAKASYFWKPCGHRFCCYNCSKNVGGHCLTCHAIIE